MGKLTSVFRMKDGEIAIPDHDYPPDARETEFALTSNVNAFRTLFCASVGPVADMPLPRGCFFFWIICARWSDDTR